MGSEGRKPLHAVSRQSFIFTGRSSALRLRTRSSRSQSRTCRAVLAFTRVEAHDMRKLLYFYLLLAGVAVVAVVSVAAQERVDQGVYWKIRQEATGNSKILQTVHM